LSVFIVVESAFGNTATVAEAVAEGLRDSNRDRLVTVAPSGEASDLPSDCDLLIVAAPTHNMGLPSKTTRAEAVKRGATGYTGPGVREWIERQEPSPELRAIAIDTANKSFFARFGTARKAARTHLIKRGMRKAEAGPSFWVEGTVGPLHEGETVRAREWGASL